MFGIFFLFTIGIGLSLIAFCIESSYYHKQQSLHRRFRIQRALLEPAILSLLINGLEFVNKNCKFDIFTEQVDLDKLDAMRDRMERCEMQEAHAHFGEVGL